MKIVLIGFMCSGKSTVGQLLASKLKFGFFDTDDMIEKEVGASIAEIIRKQGESAFRVIERKAVHLVSALDSCVVSTGGGVPLDNENMTELSKNAHVFWLDAAPEQILKRAGNLKSRPLIDAKRPLESIRERMKEREHAYSKAQHKIDTTTDSPHQIVDRMLSLIPLQKT